MAAPIHDRSIHLGLQAPNEHHLTMSLLHWLADIAACPATLLVVVAGVIGLRHWQSPGGWLLVGAGIITGWIVVMEVKCRPLLQGARLDLGPVIAWTAVAISGALLLGACREQAMETPSSTQATIEFAEEGDASENSEYLTKLIRGTALVINEKRRKFGGMSPQDKEEVEEMISAVGARPWPEFRHYLKTIDMPCLRCLNLRSSIIAHSDHVTEALDEFGETGSPSTRFIIAKACIDRDAEAGGDELVRATEIAGELTNDESLRIAIESAFLWCRGLKAQDLGLEQTQSVLIALIERLESEGVSRPPPYDWSDKEPLSHNEYLMIRLMILLDESPEK